MTMINLKKVNALGHSLLLLITTLFLMSCGYDGEKEAFLNNCSDSNADVSKFSISRIELKPISIEPIHYKPSPRYSYARVSDKDLIIETSLENNIFTIYDLSEGRILIHDSLKTPPIKVGITTFKGLDSIYFQIPERSKIYRFSSNGGIREIIDLSDQGADWMMPDSPVGPLSTQYQGQINFTKSDQMIFVLDAFDFWMYPEKESVGLLASYDLQEKTLKADFSQHLNYLTKSKISLPDRFTYPFIESLDNYIFASYPWDHQIYKYDNKSYELIQSSCVSSTHIERLFQPLPSNFDTQESINLQISAPYYGQVNFHEDLNVFSRLVFHENKLHQPDGKLNLSSCERTYSLILFDHELNVKDEIFLGNNDLWEIALPTPKGYLVTGKCQNYSGEDYLRINFAYEIYQ